MKSLKIGLIVILSVIALLLSAGLWIVLDKYTIGNRYWENRDDTVYSGGLPLQSSREIEASQVQELEINFQGTGYDIEVLQGTEDSIILEEYFPFGAEEENLAVVTYEGDSLAICSPHYTEEEFDWRSIWEEGGFLFGSRKGGRVRLYIPRRIFESLKRLSVSGSSGDIEAPFLQADSAEITSSSGHIEIGEGMGNFQVSATSGDIEIENGSGDFQVSTTSGEIKIGTHTGALRLSSSSGEKEIGSCNGDLISSASSGDTEVKALTGGADISSSSGEISLYVEELAGDIMLEGSSGGMTLSLPENAAFTFQAETGSGRIDTAFDNALSYNKRGNAAEGMVGDNPVYDVDCKFSSGDVRVMYGRK